MPVFNETTDDKLIKKNQDTTPGLFVSSGIIDHGDYDQKDWYDLIKDYTEMRNLDPVIKGSSDSLVYPILASERIIRPSNDTPEAKEIARYIDWSFDNLTKGFQYLKYHKLLAIFFGCSIHEIVVKRNDIYIDSLGKKRPTNRIIKMAPIMPETVQEWQFDEETFDLLGIKQEKRIVNGGSVDIEIPIEKLNILTFNEEFDDPRGNSLLRPIRMSWESKKKVLLTKVLQSQRGAGIPRIETQGLLNTAEAAKVNQLGRTLAQGVNSYISYDVSKMKVDLLEPVGQNDVLPLLEYLNREIFFNTLTEFLTAGIGQNGSRAATSEHKSAYELSASYILQVLEDNFQALSNQMVAISYYGNQPKENWPIFNFGAIVQTDLTNTATQLEKLINSGWVQKRAGDEDQIREAFSLPTGDLEAEAGNQTENEEEEAVAVIEEGEMCSCGGTFTLSHRRELSDNEKYVFELASAQDFYLNIQDKTQNILDKYIGKMFDSIIEQVERKGQDTNLTIPYKGLLTKELLELYQDGFNRGERDVNKEINKVVKQNTALQIDPKKIVIKKKSIDRFVTRLITNVATISEDRLQKVSAEFIAKKGGVKVYLDVIKDGFKTDRRAVASEVEASYIDGRGETIKARKSEIQLWEYSAILDNNLCEICGPFDGNQITYEEMKDFDLQPAKPVNLNCLGKNNCRCVLIPSQAS